MTKSSAPGSLDFAMAEDPSFELDPNQSVGESTTPYSYTQLGSTNFAQQSRQLRQTTPVNDHSSGEVIERVLRKSAYASVRAIKARVEHNVVVLQGNVPSFYLRQLALAAAMKHMPGVFIIDFIDVDYN